MEILGRLCFANRVFTCFEIDEAVLPIRVGESRFHHVALFVEQFNLHVGQWKLIGILDAIVVFIDEDFASQRGWFFLTEVVVDQVSPGLDRDRSNQIG